MRERAWLEARKEIAGSAGLPFETRARSTRSRGVGDSARRRAGADGAAHARAAEAAVAHRVLVQVLLVVVLGVVERAGRGDLAGDRAAPARRERLVVRLARPLDGIALRLARVVDRRA